MKISSSLYFAVVSLLAATTTKVYAFLPSQLHHTSTLSSSPSALYATRIVWLTGYEDLRIRDHGGFADAFSSNDDTVVPVFILDPELHLSCKSSSAIERLHNSLSSLESELDNIGSQLIIRLGSATTILPSLVKDIDDATITCHVIADDVTLDMRTVQRDICNRLEEMGIDVCRWSNSLRPSAPWAEEETNKRTIMPSFYPEYCKIADNLSNQSPVYDYLTQKKDTVASNSSENNVLQSEGLPSIEELINMSIAVTPQEVLDFQKRCLSTDCTFSSSGSTVEPYEQLITNKWSTESGVRTALEEYCQQGKDSFANKHFAISNNDLSSNKSMYEAASNRIVVDNNPSDVLALREAPTRAFSLALNLGSISARDVIDAAKNRHDGDDNDVSPSDDPPWGRSSQGALSDVIEWREWFRLLAERSLELQDQGKLATSGGEKEQGGCLREVGTVHYWRWKGQHLVRYITWPAGKDYIEDADDALPAILLVHGFAASAEQWERLVYSLRQQYGDKCPPIFAVDLLGFGHSEKPGLSYTQYLWEAQLVDFGIEVMKAKPMVMVGNSIGGGLSAGASASLGVDICKGLVLCNTAGILEEPANYVGYNNGNQYKYGTGPMPTAKQIDSSISSHTEAALKGNPNEGLYSPVPLVGKNALDLFGRGIIQLIYPQIEKRLSLIYNNNMENADEAAIYAIQQSAMHPGSANVIGSGQKLAPNRPLNEVLIDHVDGGLDVLVVMGLDDQVSSPAAAQTRAELFSRLNLGKVVVDEIADAGHCPHDDKPELVAQSIVKWLDDI